MNLFKIFQKQSKLFYFSIIMLGVISSVIYSSILVFINRTVSGEPLDYFPEYDWQIFLGLIAISFLCSKLFQNYMVTISNDILFDIELSIVNKVRQTTYETFEKLGSQRIYTAISDTRMLGRLPDAFINLINSSIIILCGIGYLLWISPIGGLCILFVMAALLTYYVLRNNSIEKELNVVRDLHDEYYSYLKELLYGFKQMKMSTSRSRNIFEKFLSSNRLKGKNISIKASQKYVDNELTGTYSWYVVLGAIMFVLPTFSSFENSLVSVFIMVVLFMMAPVANLIMFLPFYTSVKIALERIYKLESELDYEYDTYKSEGDQCIDYNEITFEEVVYKYVDDQNKAFTIGPLNLTFVKGEIVFITGGNGAGKSTFINILTGLYKPESGRILLDGYEINNSDYAKFRNGTSAIFTDHHLFNENYDGFDLNALKLSLNRFIKMMRLERVLKIEESKGIIENKLSKGQQKRLALIYELMANKSLLVLDEWAAEQDPQFRAYFYQDLLQELKKMGKTVIAVTHDDEYFHCADRVIKFDYGKVTSDTLMKTEVLTS
ncbi:cyclic peptide export ABC transporter [Fulvivirga imtechensis]|uniref:cyclic peptide export ABC transporter n=1 Tax=Fulvivirga imtechensis TaxID=881893 RepID=UPI0002FD2577|nr:cyclic peptide export ABC transporter [Fulvivirga imtechensis]